MRELLMFNMMTLDGFFEGPENEIDWHLVDDNFNVFTIEQPESVDLLIFGRKTYELMAGYRPGEDAIKNDPVVATIMYGKPKIVCSRTLAAADWTIPG